MGLIDADILTLPVISHESYLYGTRYHIEHFSDDCPAVKRDRVLCHCVCQSFTQHVIFVLMCLCYGIEIIIVILKSVCNSLSHPKVKMEDFFIGTNIYQEKFCFLVPHVATTSFCS